MILCSLLLRCLRSCTYRLLLAVKRELHPEREVDYLVQLAVKVFTFVYVQTALGREARVAP